MIHRTLGCYDERKGEAFVNHDLMTSGMCDYICNAYIYIYYDIYTHIQQDHPTFSKYFSCFFPTSHAQEVLLTPKVTHLSGDFLVHGFFDLRWHVAGEPKESSNERSDGSEVATRGGEETITRI